MCRMRKTIQRVCDFFCINSAIRGIVTKVNPRSSTNVRMVKDVAKFALTLVIIGALNWLLVGLFEWDLVTALFGGDVHRESSALSRVIYILVGLAGLYSFSFYSVDRSSGK